MGFVEFNEGHADLVFYWDLMMNNQAQYTIRSRNSILELVVEIGGIIAVLTFYSYIFFCIYRTKIDRTII